MDSLNRFLREESPSHPTPLTPKIKFRPTLPPFYLLHDPKIIRRVSNPDRIPQPKKSKISRSTFPFRFLDFFFLGGTRVCAGFAFRKQNLAKRNCDDKPRKTRPPKTRAQKRETKFFRRKTESVPQTLIPTLLQSGGSLLLRTLRCNLIEFHKRVPNCL